MRAKSTLVMAALLAVAPITAACAKDVTIALGTNVLTVGYPNISLALVQGYWKQEGLNVSFLNTPGTLQGIQQLVGGGAQFAEGNAAGFMQGMSKTGLPLRIGIAYGVVDWKFIVPKNSPIGDAQGLKGKKLGVVSLASGASPLAKAYLRKNGIDESDVELVPVGFGATAIEALAREQVDALLFWGSAVASFENAGLEMKTFADPEWSTWPDYVLGTTEKIAADDPDMVVGMNRGMAKAILFAQTNPDCAVSLHWKAFPETKAKAVDETTARQFDLNVLKAKTDGFALAAKLYDGKWGDVEGRYWEAEQRFLVEAGQMNAAIAPADFKIGIADFYDKVNDFDHDAVIAEAKACKLD